MVRVKFEMMSLLLTEMEITVVVFGTSLIMGNRCGSNDYILSRE